MVRAFVHVHTSTHRIKIKTILPLCLRTRKGLKAIDLASQQPHLPFRVAIFIGASDVHSLERIARHKKVADCRRYLYRKRNRFRSHPPKMWPSSRRHSRGEPDCVVDFVASHQIFSTSARKFPWETMMSLCSGKRKPLTRPLARAPRDGRP